MDHPEGRRPSTSGKTWCLLLGCGLPLLTVGIASILIRADKARKIETRAIALPMAGHSSGTVLPRSFSANGELVLTSNDTNELAVWSVRDGKRVAALDQPEPHGLVGVALSADGASVIELRQDGRLVTRAVADGKVQSKVTVPPRSVVSLPERKTRLTVDDKRTATILGPDDKPCGQIAGAGTVYFLDNERVAVLPQRLRADSNDRWDGRLRVHSLADGKQLDDLTLPINSLETWGAISQDGTLVATYDGPFVALFSVADRQARFRVRAKPAYSFVGMSIGSIAFSPRNDLIAVAGLRGEPAVVLISAKDGSHVRTLQGHANGIEHVLFSPSGDVLVSGAGDNRALVWDLTAPR